MPTSSDSPLALAPPPRPGTAGWVAILGEPKTGEGESARRGRGDDVSRVLRVHGAAPSSFRADAGHERFTVFFDGILHDSESLAADSAAPEPALADAARVARAYRRWGEAALDRLSGRFAVIIWDAARDLLLAARDPVGFFPLYWTTSGRELLVSPSPAALVQAPGVSAAVHRAVLADYICRRWPGVDETFLLGVRRVPPGHVLRVHRGQPQVSRYWHLAPPGRAVDWVREDELERFEGLFTRAVDRCVGGGAAGVYLSGGLDSVSVAAAAVDLGRLGGAPMPWALSLLFPGTEIDEAHLQRGVAAALGMPQACVPFDEAAGPGGILSAALRMSRQWPWPLLNPWNPAFQHLGAHGVERGCRVILTGHGGDEWLAASPAYTADLVRSFDLRGLARQFAATAQSYSISWPRMLRLLLWHYGVRPVLAETAATALRQLAPGFMHAHRRRALDQLTPTWIAPDPALQRELRWRIEQRVEASLRERREERWHLSEVRSVLDSFLQPMEFEEWFENGRRLGAPVLAPFWDPDLVRFLYRVPPRLLTRNGWSKGLVRGPLARRFPGLGFDRQAKVTVRTFHRDLMLRDSPQAWRALGGAPAMAELGLADAPALASWFGEVFAGVRGGEWSRIWQVLSVEAWLRGRLSHNAEGTNDI
jgi:asparagine synthase (glutamine-hydrolysing)